METFFDVLESVSPLVFMALVVMDHWHIRNLERRIAEHEKKKTEEGSEKKDTFWERYETTRPKVK